jgi:hypothetical protein
MAETTASPPGAANDTSSAATPMIEKAKASVAHYGAVRACQAEDVMGVAMTR